MDELKREYEEKGKGAWLQKNAPINWGLSQFIKQLL
jgi:hypothetical protein